jgi:hypothetical protein
MILRPTNIVRKLSHSHKPSFPFDYASWHKSQDIKAINDMNNKINDMSNKIDDVYFKMNLATYILKGSAIGAGIGITIPVIIRLFKSFF